MTSNSLESIPEVDRTLNILMPVYNCSPYLAVAIDSVLAQTYPDFLLHIVDDGSSDDSLATARRYEQLDARVRVTTQLHAGIANTLNAGIDRLQRDFPSEWIFCMHGDDVMLPNRLQRQLAFIGQNPELAVVSALVRVIDERGRDCGYIRSALTTRAAVQSAVADGDSIAFNHPAAAFRPAAIKAVGGYRQDFWPAEDTELWNRIAAAGYGVLVQDETLLKYRIHARAASTQKARLMIQKMAWMMRCLEARRSNTPEPSWEQFVSQRKNLPWFARCNDRRREWARTLYQVSLYRFTARRYASLLPALAAATLLEPGLVVRRVAPRLRPRSGVAH